MVYNCISLTWVGEEVSLSVVWRNHGAIINGCKQHWTIILYVYFILLRLHILAKLQK